MPFGRLYSASRAGQKIKVPVETFVILRPFMHYPAMKQEPDYPQSSCM